MFYPAASAPNVTYRAHEQNTSPALLSTSRVTREKLTVSRVMEATRCIFLAALANIAYLCSAFLWTSAREYAVRQYSRGADLFHLKLKVQRMPSVACVANDVETTKDHRSGQNSAPSLQFWSRGANKIKTGPELSTEEEDLSNLSIDCPNSPSHEEDVDLLSSPQEKMKEKEESRYVEESSDLSGSTEHENVLPPSQDSSLSTDSEEVILHDDNIREFLDDAFRFAVREMNEGSKLGFDMATRTDWGDGKYFYPRNFKATDEIGGFCVNRHEPGAIVPIEWSVEFALTETQEAASFQFYCLVPNLFPKEPQLNGFNQNQVKTIGNCIANLLKQFNSHGFTDFNIYKALEEALYLLQDVSSDPDNFSIDIAILLNEKIWVAHLGSGAVFLSNKGEAIPLTCQDFSIIDYPLEKIQPDGKLFLINSDIKQVAGIQQIAKAEYQTNQGCNGLNNGYAAKTIACATYTAGAQKPATLIAHIPGTQKSAMNQEAASSSPPTAPLSSQKSWVDRFKERWRE